MASIDHLVLVAESLEQGAEFVAQQLGVEPQPAWETTDFGTHSLAVRLGAECYLDIIAIDPSAANPKRPRWYGLDQPDMKRTLMHRPRLFGWAVRVEGLDASIKNAVFDVGEPVALLQGDLGWRQTVPRDGSLILFGAGPSLIERTTTGHPSRRLKDQGCTLTQVRLFDEAPERMRYRLASVGADALVTLEQGNAGESRIEACIETPHGQRLLL
jgi:hypothetical protein